MTTHDHRTHEELIAEAHADLEELRQLDICDPLELTRPFRQWSTQLSSIGETLREVAFAATIDDGVRRRVEYVLGEMSAAARLVETAALATLFAEDRSAAAGVRTWFDAALRLPAMYASLTSSDVCLGTEQTAHEAGIEIDADLAELREAIKRGDIVVPRTKDGMTD